MSASESENSEMVSLTGIAASPGVAIGMAVVLDSDSMPTVPRRFISGDKVADAINTFKTKAKEVAAELRSRAEAAVRINKDVGSIIAAQAGMVEDEALTLEICKRIENHHFSAEYAVMRGIHKYKDLMLKTGDEYIMQRVSDLSEIEKMLLRKIIGGRVTEFNDLPGQVILVAHEISVGLIATINPQNVIAFIAETGGRTSHAAIIARAYGIPAVVGVSGIAKKCSTDDEIIVDGNRGIVQIHPNDDAKASCNSQIAKLNTLTLAFLRERNLPTQTTDGAEVKLNINIEFPDEIDAKGGSPADGVGLYRTEFLFTSQATEPSEEDHYHSYLSALKYLNGRELTIRTYDLGADKLLHRGKINSDIYNELEALTTDERNPALGCRAIRLILAHKSLGIPQIRAICRASAHGKVRVMVPMVCCHDEMQAFRRMIVKEQERLDQEDIEFDADMPVGMMVEVPAVISCLDTFMDSADFFSIGTNDLTQYAMAVDRGNDHVASLYRPANPGVLRMIRAAIALANEYQRPVSICGEIAGDTTFTYLLLGMGLRSFSVSPRLLPEIKKLIRSISLTEAQTIAENAMRLKNSAEISAFLREATLRHCPDCIFT